ncbi:hypothetical protein DVH24_002988 [Malus domestica]|uniref:non-specific serine/threonine protein kinase n=1 Tax=Malus domestica TaxID=3750 RepID=A0A498K3X9_MALDO|nr:hypothetical protein DVH24_002988 [Malus domestica]
MRYSLLAGGKRVRPVLHLVVDDDGDVEPGLKFGSGTELGFGEVPEDENDGGEFLGAMLLPEEKGLGWRWKEEEESNEGWGIRMSDEEVEVEGAATYSLLSPQTTKKVKTLETISRKLHNPHWKNISQTSCQDGGVGFFKYFTAHIFSNVTCKCSFANNTCHVRIIKLKGLNLTGVIPEEFGDLTHLEEIDLTHNYISGSIPASISRCPIRSLYLLGNRLSGSIPAGDFTLLRELVLEDNQFEGPLPQNLGRLTHLERLLLSGNNFTSTIPESYRNLKNLTDFDLQGTSMEGPIPYTISSLKYLKELMISDLNGPSMPFPTLKYMKNIQIVILRNCSISGTIPNYLGKLTKLLTLDLSFNKLTGEIPQMIERATHLSFVCLSNNILTGEVPIGILQSKRDQSVYTLTLIYELYEFRVVINATQNLLQGFVIQQFYGFTFRQLPTFDRESNHSIFINCGGRKTKFDGHTYEEDLSTFGPSSFFSSSQKWGYSSTGLYMRKPNANYIATNALSLNITGPDFYQTARIAPVSLRYYALCMLKGRYKVRLYFSEIMFTNDQTFSSLGKRLFDISIQGNLVQKDFNIMDEAGGVGKGIVKEFDNVTVLGSTLEIHLYWAGKGTTAIPYRGVYGPLISAISVTPNFDPPTESVSTIPHGRSCLPISTIVKIWGCVAVAIILIVLVILWIKRCLAHALKSKGNLMNLVDPRLGSEFNNEEMIATINVALHCCNSTSRLRPTMSAVMSMLEGKAVVQEFVLGPNPSSSTEMDEVFQSVLRGGARTLEGPSNDSAAALDDIHPVNPHSGHQDN